MKRLSLILTSLLFIFCANLCFAQEKKVVNRIESWRQDKSCNMELNKLIRTYRDKAVPTLRLCCQNHLSRCLDTYSGPDVSGKSNQTLMYTAVEVGAYDVMEFLFDLWKSYNHKPNADAYGKTIDTKQGNKYITYIMPTGDKNSLTPLMLACSKGDLIATKILIDHGANLLYKNVITNKSAYDYAKEVKNPSPEFEKYIDTEYKKLTQDYDFE